MSSPEYFQDKKSKLTKREKFFYGAVAAATLYTGGVIALLAVYANPTDMSNNKRSEIGRAVEQDGFDNLSGIENSTQETGEYQAIVSYGNCALRLYFSTDNRGGTLDANNYHFGNESAEFAFESKQELDTQILGEKPCVTIAAAGLVQTSLARAEGFDLHTAGPKLLL